MLGRIVIHRLSAAQAREANARTIPGKGNYHQEGDEVPMIVVRDWGGAVNGQALLDGEARLWVCSAARGSEPGQWKEMRHEA